MAGSGGRRLRAALVAQFPSEDGRSSSGVAGVVAALADGLSAAGVDVQVITCVKGLDRITKRETPQGVTVHSVPSPGKLAWLVGFPVEVAGIRSVLESIEPDIVHCHTQTVYSAAALERGWPSVLTIHGIYAREVTFMRGWRRFQGMLLTRFERAAFRRAKHVVCISEYLRRAIGDAFEGKDVRLIENPIDDRYFGVVNEEEPGRILYAGTIINRKNLLGLLEATRLLTGKGRNVRLRVAGSRTIEPDYYGRCAKFVKDNGLEDRVDFLGTLPVDAMLGELSKAILLALPSFQETAPMVISEAMAAGKPIVTTPAGGSADMVEDGKAGFVVPFGDNEALADAIGKLLSDAELRANMGQYARGEAERRYKCSVVVDKTLAFYEDILRSDGK
jgi:glycosyltransferase involved in cell wall biosynthesis